MSIPFAVFFVVAEIWLFAHGDALYAAVFALIAVPAIFLALRRERRG